MNFYLCNWVYICVCISWYGTKYWNLYMCVLFYNSSMCMYVCFILGCVFCFYLCVCCIDEEVNCCLCVCVCVCVWVCVCVCLCLCVWEFNMLVDGRMHFVKLRTQEEDKKTLEGDFLKKNPMLHKNETKKSYTLYLIVKVLFVTLRYS